MCNNIGVLDILGQCNINATHLVSRMVLASDGWPLMMFCILFTIVSSWGFSRKQYFFFNSSFSIKACILVSSLLSLLEDSTLFAILLLPSSVSHLLLSRLIQSILTFFLLPSFRYFSTIFSSVYRIYSSQNSCAVELISTTVMLLLFFFFFMNTTSLGFDNSYSVNIRLRTYFVLIFFIPALYYEFRVGPYSSGFQEDSSGWVQRVLDFLLNLNDLFVPEYVPFTYQVLFILDYAYLSKFFVQWSLPKPMSRILSSAFLLLLDDYFNLLYLSESLGGPKVSLLSTPSFLRPLSSVMLVGLMPRLLLLRETPQLSLSSWLQFLAILDFWYF